MLLCSIVILVQPGKLAQLAFAFIVTMFFMSAQTLLMPYKEDDDDNYAVATMLSTILTLFAGIVIKARVGSQLEETWIEKLIINFVLIVCNIGVLVIFVVVIGKSAASGGGKDKNVAVQKRILAKAKNAGVVVAAQQAQEYIDEIFESLREYINSLIGESDPKQKGDANNGAVMVQLVDAMHEDLTEGGRGRYAGQVGIAKLMEDVNELATQTSMKGCAQCMLHIASGFASEGVIRCLGEFAVVTLEGYMASNAAQDTKNEAEESSCWSCGGGCDEGVEIEEEDVEVLRVAVKVMCCNVANRDVLVEKMMGLFNPSDLPNFPKKLQSLPFLLCPDQDTLQELVLLACKRIARHLAKAGVSHTELLPPLGEQLVAMHIRGDKQAYTPEEFFDAFRNIITKGLEDPEAAGHLLLGMARKMLGDRFVEMVIEKFKRAACAALLETSQQLLEAQGMNAQEITLLGMLGKVALEYDADRLENICSRLSSLPSHAHDPTALMEAVHAIAESVLGKELLNSVLNSALDALLKNLEDTMIQNGVEEHALVSAMGLNAAEYMIDNGVEALQKDIEDIMAASSPGVMSTSLLVLCRKVVGSAEFEHLVSAFIMEPLLAKLNSMMQDAGCTSSDVSLMTAMGRKIVTYTPESLSQVLSKMQQLPELVTDKDALMDKVKEIGEDVLGKKVIKMLLDTALATLASQLKALLAALKAPAAYQRLGEEMVINSGNFVMKHGAAALQDQITTVMNTAHLGLNDTLDQLARACEKVVGTVQFVRLMALLIDDMVAVAKVLLTNAGVPDQYSGLIVTCGVEVLRFSDEGKNNSEQMQPILNKIQQLPKHANDPEKLTQAVRFLAEGLLGKEVVDALLDQAVVTLLEKLKQELLEAGAGQEYADLAQMMVHHASGYILENGLAGLQTECLTITAAGGKGDVEEMKRMLLQVSQKVMGTAQFKKAKAKAITAAKEAATKAVKAASA